jgi:hypothetical protein
MEKLITIRSFNSSVDSEMVRAYLESMGVTCFLQDELINRAYIANVNGGVKLQVPENELENAILLLKEGGYLNDADLEPSSEIKWVDKFLQMFRKKG